MNFDRVHQTCPYLLGSTEGVMCSAAVDFIRNVRDIKLEICMSRHFESCHIYFAKLRDLSKTQESENNSC